MKVAIAPCKLTKSQLLMAFKLITVNFPYMCDIHVIHINYFRSYQNMVHTSPVVCYAIEKEERVLTSTNKKYSM